MVNLLKPSGQIPLRFLTERLHVRRYAPHDRDDLYAAARESVSEIYPFLPWCHPGYSRDEATDWIGMVESSWQTGEEYNFAIKDRNSGVFYGGIGLNQIRENHVANLGYWMRTTATGHGYVTEATRGLIDFAFRNLGLKRLEIIMSIENPASRKIAINVGATCEGTLRDRLPLHGENHDAYLYSLIPDDFTEPGETHE